MSLRVERGNETGIAKWVTAAGGGVALLRRSKLNNPQLKLWVLGVFAHSREWVLFALFTQSLLLVVFHQIVVRGIRWSHF